MDDCMFCDWMKNNELKHILLEDDYAIAVLAEEPFRMGQCIVWVKRHITSISEVSPEENASVFSMITKISKVLEHHYRAEKTWLLSIGDQIRHIHYHLIPKIDGQISIGYYSFIKMMEAEGTPELTDEELNRTADGLTKLLNDV